VRFTAPFEKNFLAVLLIARPETVLTASIKNGIIYGDREVKKSIAEYFSGKNGERSIKSNENTGVKTRLTLSKSLYFERGE